MAAALTSAVASCSPFDDSEFRERIDGYKTRIEVLKEKAGKLNSEIETLSQLTNGNVITSVSQNSDGKYVITYKDDSDQEKSLVIATSGDLIDVPILGVKEEDGVFYWTVTTKDDKTDWLIVDGQKVPVRGNTPVLAVDADGDWTVNGEKVKDANGQTVKANDDSSSIFKDASFKDGVFTMVLGNGNVITLPVFNTLNLTLNTVANVIIADPSMTYKVKYELTGEAKDEAIVAVAKTAGGVNAELDRENQEIAVTFGPDFSFESDGRMIVMAYDLAQNTIIKPVFFAGVKESKVKISTAEQLIQFATDVNSGNNFEGMEIFLSADIDLKDVANWAPIGNASFTGTEMTGASFSGTFDGQGHTIDGLRISDPAVPANTSIGLFGSVQNGTVKNVTLGSNSKIDVTSTGLLHVGGIAGGLYGKSVVENCTNEGEVKATVGEKDKRISLGGVVGMTYALTEDIYIRDCVNKGKISTINQLSTNNGGNGVSAGGVVGFADANADEGKSTYIIRCENLSDFTAEATRIGGVIASLNRSAHVQNCINRGNITSKEVVASNCRVSGITAMVNNASSVSDCKNYGDITYAIEGSKNGYAAGIAGQMQVANVSVTGCENYGAIRSDIIKQSKNKYIAIICSNTNKTACTVSNNKIGGKIGPYVEDADFKLTDITPENFSQYVFFHLAGTDPIAENNVFAMDLPTVGIKNADDLAAFAAAVNSGASLDSWKDAEGVINLLGDIDMSGVKNWTPIGEASFNWASNKLSITSGNPFTGHFNGNGFAVKNFAMVCKAAGTASNAWGLFGALSDGAVVENLVIDSSCSLSFEATEPTDAGVLAGLVYNSTVRRIENNASVTLPASTTTPDAKRVSLAGIVGFAFAGGGEANIEKCVNKGSITAASCGNTKNGATGLHVGGIVGFSSNLSGVEDAVNITECDNYGDINSAAARASGIVAAANRYTMVRKCTNYGNNVNSHATSGNSRLGNITCIAAAGSKLIECVNKGNLTSSTNGRVGGIISLVNDDNVVLDRVENYGQIVSDNKQYTGTIFGYCAKKAGFTACIAQGDVGVYEGGSIALTGLNAANYFSHIGYYTSAAVNVTPANIIWSTNAASTEFSVAPAVVSLNVWGTSAAVVELSAMNEDWTVTSDEWISTTDLNGKAITEGVKSNDVFNVKIGASVNSSTNVRTGSVVFTSKADASKTATVTVNQDPQGPALPSKWLSGSAYTGNMYESTWTEKHIFPSTNGSSATITAVRGEANAATPLTFSIDGNKATVNTLVEGDYWLFTMPNVNLPAGSAVEFGMTTGGDANQPKYFIVEWFDGTEWKSDESTLFTAAENSSLKYSYMASGDMGGSTYENNTVAQVIRFDKAINGDLKIRSRAVGNKTAGGATQNINAVGKSLFYNFGFTAAYVSDLGVVNVKDVKNVLCLGNSFSYYSNPVLMLQEIAYSQGHLLRIKANLKGSQTYSQHCALKLSQHAINAGGFDFAILQDQSSQPAKYGDTADPEILKGCQDITALVKAASPNCQRILEQTWSYSGSTFGGFGSYEQFDSKCEKGAKALAEATGAWVSPIGKAFKAARAQGISLYYSDNKHQGENGAYLKACVNYCVLYGEAFSGNVPNCGIDPSVAAKLRAIAEATVLGHEAEHLIVR